MKRAETLPIPDGPPDVDESEVFDSEKHASRREQQDPGGETGFVPVDDALSQGELFGEKIARTQRQDTAAPVAPDTSSAAPRDPAPEDHDDADVDEALRESFPASDPPAYSPGTATGS